MSKYMLFISYGDECKIKPIVDKAAFDEFVDEIERQGYEVCKGEPEIESVGAYYEYYAVKEGKRCFDIGFERMT